MEEFKRGEDVLEVVEKFCYLGDMVSCYSGVSEAVSARIVSACKKFRELSSMLVEKQGLSLLSGFVSVVLDQFCCTVV